jgi:cyclic-di-GMP phosphodiesterase TipF (flagellum assembly factor)
MVFAEGAWQTESGHDISMPLITHALLYLGYALMALCVGLALGGVGGAGPAESFLGAMALFCALAVTHAGISAAYAAGAVGRTETRLRSEMDRVRAQNKEIAAEIETMHERVERLDMAVAEVAQRRTDPQASPDLKMIDHIVDRLGRAMDNRIDEMRRVTGPHPARERGPIEIVRDALEENRVELHLQPIVALPQRRTAFYEGFSRLRDEGGRLILPNEFLPAAEKAGLIGVIDNMLMFRAVQIVRKLAEKDRRIGIFCNLAPRALSDETFFPQFFEFLREHKDTASAMIFELPQEAFVTRSSQEARAMARLADLGYRFSIDKVTRLDVDLVDMERAGVRFFKAAGPILIEDMVKKGVRPKSTITREIAANDVPAVFVRFGIEMIAERIESEDVAAEIVDLDIPYAQGHLFGQPRAIKESLMDETAPPRGFFTREGGRGAVA